MKLERQNLEELAAQTGFRPATLEKVIRLGDFGADIARHPLLGRSLVLKGGTALNLFFGPPRRLSVDLDFNYVGSLDRAEMLRDRPMIETALETLGQRKGYRVQRSAEEHAGRKIFFGYPSALGSPDRLEVDVNYLFREPVTAVVDGVMWQPGDLEQPAIRRVGLEELAAGKVCALLSRAAARDLFDLPLLPVIAGESWKEPRFRRIIVALSAILDHPLDRYGRERLDRVTDRAVEEQLLPMLSRSQPVAVAELRARAWEALEPILDLAPEEQEYVQLVQRGELRPQLLFGEDDELVERLARHPALRWKVENARRFSGRA